MPETPRVTAWSHAERPGIVVLQLPHGAIDPAYEVEWITLNEARQLRDALNDLDLD